jgi:tetratricopeptide (TPR) repeat protein
MAIDAHARLKAALRAHEAHDPRAAALVGEAIVGFAVAGDRSGGVIARQLLAAILADQGKLGDALVHLDRALVLAEGDPAAQASVLEDRLGIALHAGDPSALDTAAALLHSARERGDHAAIGQSLHRLAGLQRQAGDAAAAARTPDEALVHLEKPGDEAGRAAVLTLRSGLALDRGRLDDAAADATRAVELATAASFVPVLADARQQLAAVRAAERSFEAARHLLVDVVAAWESIDDDRGRLAALRDLATVELAGGWFEDACARLLDVARLEGGREGWDHAIAVADAHFLEGHALAAAEGLVGVLPTDVDARIGLAKRRLNAGDLDGAVVDLATAAAQPGVDGAVARAMLGRVLADLGQPELARRELSAARALLAVLDPDALPEVDAMIAEIG